MSHLDKVLDDALLGFDDDDGGFPTSSSTPWGTAAGPTHSEGPSTAAAAPEVAASSTRAGTAADTVSLASSSGVPAAYGSKQVANTSGAPAAASTPAAAAAVPAPPPPSGSVSQGKASSSLQFDPLKRKKKGKAAAAAGAGAADLGGSSSSSRPALTPQVQQLQEDLAKLVNEWSQALHPEAEDAAAAAAAGSQQRGTSSVLQALAQQTQRTVEEQSRLRPPPSAAAAAAGGAGGASGGGGEQMNMIVDVVMQHLLSKEVLYQPMKEIMEKYPPWLDKQAAAGSSSSLTPDDLERYKHQYACITRLCQAYETEPENTAKIMQLLQEMQACGEPPAEIVEEMSSAIAADMPNLAGAGGAAGAGAGDMNFDGLDIGDIDLADLPQDLKNCPVQ